MKKKNPAISPRLARRRTGVRRRFGGGTVVPDFVILEPAGLPAA